MATKKTTKNNQKKKASAKRAPAKQKSNQIYEESLLYQCLPYLLIVLSVLLELCLIIPGQLGPLGGGISALFFGLFSVCAYVLPLLIIVVALFMRRFDGVLGSKGLLAFLCLTMICVLFEVFCPHAPTANVATLWVDGGKLSGGGVVGGLVGWVLLSLTKQVGTVIIAGAVLILCALLLFDVTPHNVWVYTRYKAHKHREAVKAAREARPPRQRYTFRVDEPEEYEEPEENKKKDIIAENERIVADMEEKMRDVPVPEEVSVTPEVERVGEGESGELDLDRIFSEEDDLPAPEEIEVPEITRVPIEPPKPVEPPKPAIRHRYEFPPVSLLKKPAGKSTAEGDEEARQNAVKLVRTLASFKVNTRISNISRGPTVTRYELVPEEGVRVRSVSNLVDDIALSLATGGVRIEAPIPGKSAIGIEVPNKVVETVYLRELIDNDEFKYAKGLTAALGMDVAGAPRYFDITKMPHLLIAGTTGSGKSVCINSILISLLYRADPEDLKLILIDPKKV
ncbi:MAG: DNA translocase FtsK, partial [Clostridia bacterium]|nr:DNA translocase FtsK [Clostridia bacterium]